jgi:hypothetical protein
MSPYQGLYRRADDERKRRMSDGAKIGCRQNGDMAHRKEPKSSELKAFVAARLKAAGSAYISNQAALARELEIDPRQINGYYLGKNYPDEAFLVKFCAVTGCTMAVIYLSGWGATSAGSV